MYILIGMKHGREQPSTIKSAPTKDGLICPVLVENYSEYKFLGVIYVTEGGIATNVEKVVYHPPRPEGKLEFTRKYTI